MDDDAIEWFELGLLFLIFDDLDFGVIWRFIYLPLRARHLHLHASAGEEHKRNEKIFFPFLSIVTLIPRIG
jgi:hypothetical protein